MQDEEVISHFGMCSAPKCKFETKNSSEAIQHTETTGHKVWLMEIRRIILMTQGEWLESDNVL